MHDMWSKRRYAESARRRGCRKGGAEARARSRNAAAGAQAQNSRKHQRSCAGVRERAHVHMRKQSRMQVAHKLKLKTHQWQERERENSNKKRAEWAMITRMKHGDALKAAAVAGCNDTCTTHSADKIFFCPRKLLIVQEGRQHLQRRHQPPAWKMYE